MDMHIEHLLFKQVGKPKDYLMTKIVNVYDNRYRINVYCEQEEDSLMKKRICASYFCHYTKDSLDIIKGRPDPTGISL
jgi:hypothetical protein